MDERLRRWVTVAALLGLVAGALGEGLTGLIEGPFSLRAIGRDGLLWGVSLGLAGGAASMPSGWVGRGAAGGVTFGLVQGGLTILLALDTGPWPALLGREVVGGLLGGLLLAYVWRPDPETTTEE